ncbi:MAG: HD domain-containing protein [bacterium]
MAKQMLAELTDGAAVSTLAVLKSKRKADYKNKVGTYLAVTLADNSGTIEAKMFDGGEDAFGRIFEGKLVEISGKAQKYNNSISILLDSIVEYDDEFNHDDFMPAYSGDYKILERELDQIIASVIDIDLKRLLKDIFSDENIRPAFCTAPAARGVHGAYIHGLLEHVVRLCRLADSVSTLYPQIDRDILLTGALLHDIGKIYEFSWSLSIEYTVLGSLHGHLVLGDRMLTDRCRQNDVPEDKAMKISHLILSHHGIPEYGTVVVPRTLEAMVLHHIDNMEAKITHCQEMLQTGLESSQWTEWDRVEGRQWYKGNNSGNNQNESAE